MSTDASLNVPYFLLTGTVLVVGLTAFLVIRPALTRIGTAQDTIGERQIKLAERQSFLETIDRKLAELEAQGAQEENLSVILPTEERIEDALRVVHRSAEATGVVIRNISNDSLSTQNSLNAERARGESNTLPPDAAALSFTIELTSSYQQFRAFMKELERSPRLMDVTSVNLQAAGDGNIGGQMAVRFYMQNPPSAN